MGVKVELASANQVVLNAPLSNNINHKSTVFGGSLHAVATLACWGLLHIHLSDFQDKKIQIVISKSDTEYLKPVTSDFKAECSFPDASEWEFFTKTLLKKNKARIKLHAKVIQNNQICLNYTGTFVAIILK